MNLQRELFSSSQNFLGLDEVWSQLERSRVVILPVPYEATVSYGGGCRHGPKAIIEASNQVELYDQELNEEVFKVGIHTLPEMEIVDDPAAMLQRVEGTGKELIKAGKFPILLGGEHTLTFGMVKAHKEFSHDLSILQLDAHADLRDSYHHNPLNHACVGRRIAEVAPLIQVGIRSLSKEEADYLKASRVKVFFAHSLNQSPRWVEEVIDNLSQEVYITIDVDYFDPSLMPSVGTPEPGGMGWYETLFLLKEVARRREVKGFDLMELAPLPGVVFPSFTVAKLLYKVVGYLFSSP